jgi:hypothetical protein
MRTTGKWKTGILVITMALICGTANAQHRNRHYYPHRVVTVVTRPDVTSHISNRFNQKERLAMAVAYLKTNKYLTIKQYVKMTQLNKAAAEAELDAFAMDKKKPIQLVIRGKKKVYIKKDNA